jgi:hypothetical protein
MVLQLVLELGYCHVMTFVALAPQLFNQCTLEKRVHRSPPRCAILFCVDRFLGKLIQDVRVLEACFGCSPGQWHCDGSHTHLSLEEAFDALTTTDAWRLC